MANIPAAQRGIFVHHPDSMTPAVVHYPEGDSQSFAAGDEGVPSSGKLVAYTQDSDGQVFAIAGRDANNNTANSDLLAWLWTPSTFFEMPLSTTNSESTATSAASNEGVIYGFNVDDLGYGFLDPAETTTANLRGRVIKLIDAAGTIAGRAIVQPVLIA